MWVEENGTTLKSPDLGGKNERRKNVRKNKHQHLYDDPDVGQDPGLIALSSVSFSSPHNFFKQVLFRLDLFD